MSSGGSVPAPTPAETACLRLEGASDFALERVLGRGGMGEVWQAEQQSLGRKLAVKTLYRELCSGMPAERFVAEAKVLARLAHPNIVPVHAFGLDEEGRPYLCMKLIRGREWAELLDPQTPEQREEAARYDLAAHLRIFQRVCDAVGFAHAQGIVHRDLKPANVMVGAFGEVLVTDWGIALDMAHRRPPGEEEAELLGTPAYLAPEMAEGDETLIGPWTDIYQLGGILYTLLTGTPPNLAPTIYEAIYACHEGLIEPPWQRAPDRRIPLHLAELAMRCLARDPAERPPSAAALFVAVDEHFKIEAASKLAGAALEKLSSWERAGRKRRSRSAEVYAGLQRCVSELEQALGLWPACRDAAEGRVRARLAVARFALRQGDPGIAESYLEPLPPATPGVAALRLQAAGLRSARASAARRRRRRHTALLLAGAALLAALAVGLGVQALRWAARVEEANRRRTEAQQVVDGATWKTETDRIELYRRALAIDPSWLDAYLELAGAHMDRAWAIQGEDPAGCTADLELARRVLDDVLRLEPDFVPGLGYRGYTHEMLGDSGRMLADYRRVVALAPEDGEALSAGTVIALAEGRWADAERLASTALAQGGDEDNLSRRAHVRYVLGDLDGALHDAELCGQNHPQTPYYDALASLFLLARGEEQVAAERLLAGLGKSSSTPQILALAAYLAARRGDAERARLIVERGRAELHSRARCYLDVEPVERSLTRAEGQRGELGKAFLFELDLDRVAPPRPARAVELRARARRALASGAAALALAEARRALADDATDGEARLLHGLALARLGYGAAARADLTLVAPLAPDHAAEAAAVLAGLDDRGR